MTLRCFGDGAIRDIKRFKRIALRCEKTAQNYGSFVALACAFILIKSVHTAYRRLRSQSPEPVMRRLPRRKVK